MSKLSVEKLEELSKELKAYCLIAICAAGSGHPGGCLSILDILTALYFNIIHFDPINPCHGDRDRLFISKGHIAPALYVTLAKAGFYDMGDMVSFRQFESPFQGHPNMCMLSCLEISSGSLGQGLGISVGSALSAKLKGQKHKIYCIMGDGEQQEGNIWESAMSAAHFKLDNLIGIVDNNRLQLDGFTKDIMNIEPIADKYRSFGWHVIEIDGNNMNDILNAFKSADKISERPILILANTIKGKGVSFIENKIEWHGKSPDYYQLKQALHELNFGHLPYDKLLNNAQTYAHTISQKIEKSLPKFRMNYGWNAQPVLKVEMQYMNEGILNCLRNIGDDERIVVLPADSHKMVTKGFVQDHPERANRVFNLGIAEQNAAVVSAGLAKEGFIPVIGAYSTFCPGRNWDQIRTSICFCRLNVKIIAVGGLIGYDGGSHEGLEEIGLTASLPNMRVSIPCDIIETEKAAKENILNIHGPSLIRVGKIALPVITTTETPYKFGIANIIRYREDKQEFKTSFQTVLSSEYKNEGERLCIIACGTGVSESMRAAYILKKDFDIETRIINIHTIKPIDKQAIIHAAEESELIITVEEHQKGGLGNIIAGVISHIGKKARIEMIGVEDKFGESGSPYNLIKAYGLSAEHIAQRAISCLAI